MCKAAMLNVIRKMTQTDGIIAAGFKHKEDGLHVACRGLPRDEAAIMAAVVGMLDLIQDNPLTWERSVAPPRAMLKLDIGEEAWNAGRQDGVTLILVSVKGHPVAKSLKRMLRIAFKKAAKAMNQPAPATLRVLPTPVVSLNDPEPGVPSVVSDPKTTKLDTST